MARYKCVKIGGVKHDCHRLIMEEALGRKLHSDEIVHHINGNPLDNDINNLQLMTRSEHAKLHSKEPYFPEWVSEQNRERMLGQPAVNRKLSGDDVTFIKNHYIPKDKDFGVRPLARKYNVAHTVILRILNGTNYRDAD